MATHVYRFKLIGPTAGAMAQQVPGAPAPGSFSPAQFFDVTVDSSSLGDLTDFMAAQGFAFDSTDPVTTPAQAASADANYLTTINTLTEKTTPVGADLVLIEDSAAGYARKKVQVTNLPGGSGTDANAIHKNVAAEISTITEKTTPVAADLLIIEDSAAANAKKRVQIGNLPGGSGTITVKEEGTALTPGKSKLNFVGPGITATTDGVDSAQANVTVAVATPTGLTVGGSNVTGTADSLAASDHVHALPAFGTTAGTFTQGNDSRLSDARTPTGTASGDLQGTYPGPTILEARKPDLGIVRTVRCASTVNIASITGLLVIDGVTTVAGDKVLLKNQSTASQNGIYVAAAGAWSYCPNCWTQGGVVSQETIYVQEGSTQAKSVWRVTNTGTITVGATGITFQQDKLWPFMAQVRTVATDGRADFTTISAAIADAASGTATVAVVILIAPGAYPEKIFNNSGRPVFLKALDGPPATTSNTYYSVKVNPVLVAGEACITEGSSGELHADGIWFAPTFSGGVGPYYCAWFRSNFRQLTNCKLEIANSGASTSGNVYTVYDNVNSGPTYMANCFVIGPSGTIAGSKRSFYADNGSGPFYVRTCRFDNTGVSPVEINSASAKVYFLGGCVFEGAFTVTAGEYWLSPDSIILGTRTTASAPAISGVTPNGTLWYDTSTNKMKVRENGISKDLYAWWNEAKSFTVDPSGSADYTTIQAAINAATVDSGTVIRIAPGVYAEQLTLKSGVHLLGDMEVNGSVSATNPPGVWVQVSSATSATLAAFAGSGGDVQIHNIAFNLAGTGAGGQTYRVIDTTGSSNTPRLMFRNCWMQLSYVNVTGGAACAVIFQPTSTAQVLLHECSSYANDAANSNGVWTGSAGWSVGGVGEIRRGTHTSSIISGTLYTCAVPTSGTLYLYEAEYITSIARTGTGIVNTYGGNWVNTTVGDADDGTGAGANFSKHIFGGYQTDGTKQMQKLALRSIAGDVPTPSDGDVWYNSTTQQLVGKQGGATFPLKSSNPGFHLLTDSENYSEQPIVPGPQGNPGTNGVDGATGAQGPVGPPVFLLGEGDEGPMGPPGPQGLQGTTGSAGSTGAQGPVGPPIFLLGEQGDEGPMGPPGILVPGGVSTSVQYNGGGVLSGAALVNINANGSLELELDATPVVPAANTVGFFGRKVGNGRMMPSAIGPSGLDWEVQPNMFRNAVCGVFPNGNGTTLSSIRLALTATGTATAANWASTSLHTSMKRIDYLVTVASTTAVAGFRGAAQQFWFGNAAGLGGFTYVCRWAPATGQATTTSRAFCGMAASTSAPTDVQPSSLLNVIGMGWDAADTNVQFMSNDGSGTCAKVDLGASFPVGTTDRAKVYEIAMFVAPNTSVVNYEVTDLTTGAVATGSVSVSTDLPSNTTALNPWAYCSVGGTSSVIGIALFSLYIETDY